MSETVIGIIGICVLFVLFFLKMPIGFAMGFVGFLGICAVKGLGPALPVMALVPIRHASYYIMTAIPLFVLMGLVASNTGLGTDAFYAANKWVGNRKGGLAMSSIGGSAAFGAVCGDIIAAAVTMCSVCLPEMRKYKYSDELSLGAIAAGANLSFLIPPSIGFIIYAILTEVSIGSLFAAGLLPGIILTFLFLVTVYISCLVNPSLAPPGSRESWKERILSLKSSCGFLLLIVIVLGGIYAGVVTPTEAGALGSFGAMLLGIIQRRITWELIAKSFGGTANITGMIFTLIIGAMIFNTFMAVTEIPLILSKKIILELKVPPYLLLFFILVLYILIGFVMDIMAVIMLMVPILHPILVASGFDPIWLGVLTIIVVCMGHISPPFGLVVFVIAGVVPDVPMFNIFRGAFPFLIAMFICLILVIVFPEIALLLPRLMMK
jgi:tripartite ATP-independent transporter DctM subunit